MLFQLAWQMGVCIISSNDRKESAAFTSIQASLGHEIYDTDPDAIVNVFSMTVQGVSAILNVFIFYYVLNF
jgi:hypothetical protein